MNVYAMKRHWFKTLMGVLAVTAFGVAVLFSPNQAAAYQAASTPEGVVATIIYPDPINVRGGPSTVHYPIVGQLFPGDVVPALGVSPGHEWVQIGFPGAANGRAWVYAVFVTVSGGELPVVEAPPTPTPLVTATIDPTFAAAFDIQPTQTRMPTFTPPPPLTVPAFEDESSAGLGFGGFIMGLSVLGLLGLIVTFVLRK
jgi:uncharacterized protein YraI